MEQSNTGAQRKTQTTNSIFSIYRVVKQHLPGSLNEFTSFVRLMLSITLICASSHLPPHFQEPSLREAYIVVMAVACISDPSMLEYLNRLRGLMEATYATFKSLGSLGLSPRLHSSSSFDLSTMRDLLLAAGSRQIQTSRLAHRH